MRCIPALVLALALAAPGNAAVNDIPDGSTATITPLPGLAMLRIAQARRVYTLPVTRIVGIQDKPAGCILWIEGPSGVQQLDYVLSGEQMLTLVRAALAPMPPAP
jgi:hypothetical protein